MINITIPNLPKFQTALRKWPEFAEKEIKKALEGSIYSIEREAKLLTPVLTGRLRASLGGGTFKGGSYPKDYNIKIEKMRASIGSNVEYATHVHSRVPFLTGGVHAAMKNIEKFFHNAAQNILDKIAKQSK